MNRRLSLVGGSVLIVVLWVSVGLAALALTFGQSMFMSYRGADNELAGRQAEQAIEGAVRYAMDVLANTTTPGVMPDSTTYQSDAVPLGEATFWFINQQGDSTATAQAGSSQPGFGLVDEGSKLNLNNPLITADILALLPGMSQEFAEAIVDWRDTDDDVTGGGAESETYMVRQPAYSAKNADFESVEELALVSGATSELLYGEDLNQNGVLDANEDDGTDSAPYDNRDGKLDPGIFQYVTAFTRTPITPSSSTTTTSTTAVALINVATPIASPALVTLLNETFQANRANELLGALYGGPPGGRPPVNSVLEFYVRSGMSSDEFGQIVDKIYVPPPTPPGSTATASDYLPGLVNVNTASEAVLACIPGLEDKAGTIVAARSQRQTLDTNTAWVVDAAGRDTLQRYGPFLTGKVTQVCADIAAVGRNGRGYRRTRFIIDLSTGTPRIVYRRNLTGLGWALGTDVRQNLAQLVGGTR